MNLKIAKKITNQWPKRWEHFESSKISKAVDKFFGPHATVYARPNTINFNANFYGYEYDELTKDDVYNLIIIADENCTGFDSIDDVIDSVLSDLQYDRPILENDHED